jgi:hypothetical protein
MYRAHLLLYLFMNIDIILALLMTISILFEFISWIARVKFVKYSLFLNLK